MSLNQDDASLNRVPFHEQNYHLKDLPPVIQKSLQRCWPRLHLEQDACIPPDQLPQLLETNSHLLSLAKPIIEEIIQSMKGSDMLLALTDPSGYVISIQGDPTITAHLSERAITIGSDLSEFGAGTNAFGLALIESAPIHVEGTEHFLRKFQNLYNDAAPIFDITSNLLGAVGFFGFIEKKESCSLALAIAAARSIMEQNVAYQVVEAKNDQIDRFEQILSTVEDGVMAWGEDGCIIYLNRAGEKILGLEKKKLLGRPFSDVVRLPEETLAAINKNIDVIEVETDISVNRRQVACLLRVTGLPGGLGTAALFRLQKDIQKMVTREYSSKGYFDLEDILGSSQQVRGVRRQVKVAAQARASVLIKGELGTGKSLLAQVIHSLSDFREGPFIVFQCASLPCEMIIPELMGTGHSSGNRNSRHTNKFELADGGVLYFQDIDLLPLEGQEVLLDFLKTGTAQKLGSNQRSVVHTRIIAASAASLDVLAAEGKFNNELLSWLRVFLIELPPLRERKMDIGILANSVLARLSCHTRSQYQLAPESLALMLAYEWPGNIRELEITMERAVYCLGSETVILPHHLPLSFLTPPVMVQRGTRRDKAQPLSQIQKDALLQAAKDCKGNVSEMARVLGIGRTTVWRWLKRLEIPLENFRANPNGQK